MATPGNELTVDAVVLPLEPTAEKGVHALQAPASRMLALPQLLQELPCSAFTGLCRSKGSPPLSLGAVRLGDRHRSSPLCGMHFGLEDGLPMPVFPEEHRALQICRWRGGVTATLQECRRLTGECPLLPGAGQRSRCKPCLQLGTSATKAADFRKKLLLTALRLALALVRAPPALPLHRLLEAPLRVPLRQLGCETVALDGGTLRLAQSSPLALCRSSSLLLTSASH
mmetsp:Transcript_39834/g.89478  ORF Transcript_39834/g.89478 Transcript_39834/m.89478 type:complete len:227 (+) Transcript_39834:423-1103(+)